MDGSVGQPNGEGVCRKEWKANWSGDVRILFGRGRVNVVFPLYMLSHGPHTRARPMHSPDRLLAPDLPTAHHKSIDVIPAPQFPARLPDPPTPTLSHLTRSTRRGHMAQLHGPHMFLAAVEPVRSDMVNRRSKPARLPPAAAPPRLIILLRSAARRAHADPNSIDVMLTFLYPPHSIQPPGKAGGPGHTHTPRPACM